MARDYLAENTRRNARRRIAKYEKQLTDKSVSERQQKIASKRIGELNRLIERTYKRTASGKKRSEKQIEKAVARLQTKNIKIQKEVFTVKKRPSNVVFRQQMRLAGNKKTEMLSTLTKKEVDEFWSYTKPIWNKKEVAYENRLEAVLKYYGSNSIAEVFEKVKEDRKKVLEDIKKRFEVGELSEEEEQWYAENNITDDGSEDKYSALIMSIVDTAIKNA